MIEQHFNPLDYDLFIQIDFDWYSSKSVIANFLSNQVTLHRDSFEPAGALALQMFLVDLGHFGRSFLQKFPLRFPFWVADTRDTTINAKAFTTQLLGEITNFLSLPENEDKAKSCAKAIGVLEKLGEISQNDKYNVLFENKFDAWYVKSMSVTFD